MVGEGIERGNSAKDVAARTDLVITMLPDGPEVEQAVLGPGGVLEGVHAGSILVDMSSISPLVSQKMASCVQRKRRCLPRCAGKRRRAQGG